jgi:hypothetical protein
MRRPTALLIASIPFILLAASPGTAAAELPARTIALELRGTTYTGLRMVTPAVFDPARLPARGELVVEVPVGTPAAAALASLAASGERLDGLGVRPSDSPAAGVGELQECTVAKSMESAPPGVARFLVRYERFLAPVQPAQGGKPDPGGPDQAPALLAAVPNLVIRSAEVKAGGMTNVQARVANTGAGPSAATAIKLFYHQGGKVETASAAVPPLAGGQQVVVAVGVDLPFAAATQVTLRVDDPDSVVESNELDNGYVLK